MTQTSTTPKEAFDAFIASLDAAVRDGIELVSMQNSWAVEVHDEFENDDARWDNALSTAQMIADDPSSFSF
jgi:hypothetical protein